MKKIFSCFLVSIFLFMVTSCGKSMRGWPTIELDIEIEKYDEVSLEYNRLPFENSSDQLHFYGTSLEKEVIDDLYKTINGLPYHKKIITNINTEKYWENVVIEFKNDNDIYTFKFYSYGVTNGYFVFDNGEIHQYYGDFVSLTYSKYKDILVLEEKR